VFFLLLLRHYRISAELVKILSYVPDISSQGVAVHRDREGSRGSLVVCCALGDTYGMANVIKGHPGLAVESQEHVDSVHF